VCEVLKDLKFEKSLKCLNVEKVLKEKELKNETLSNPPSLSFRPEA
jgi:hypothetical protein